jgi:hypothetical protein
MIPTSPSLTGALWARFRFSVGGTDHRIGSILDQMSGSARLSGSKRIFEVVYFAVSFAEGL